MFCLQNGCHTRESAVFWCSLVSLGQIVFALVSVPCLYNENYMATFFLQDFETYKLQVLIACGGSDKYF